MSEDAFPALRQRFFDQVLRYEPEEATTLGIEASRGRWKDWSPGALAAEVVFYQDVLDALDAVAPSTDDERADLDSMRRFSRWKIHSWRDFELHFGHVEASLLPNAVVQFQHAHGWDAAERFAAMPALQQQLEANWREGLARGVVPDASVLEEACRDLQEVAAFCAEHDTGAAAAWARHVDFLQAEVCPLAAERYALGEAEYSWRLEHMLGIRESPAELIERGQAHLAEIQPLIVRLASAMSPSAIDDLAGARAYVAEVQAPRLDDPMAGYGSILDCAVGFILCEGLFHLPDDLSLELLPASPGLPLAGNWPAPLLDRGASGHFVVHVDRGVHSRAWAADLAIHEGIPGHYLQSAVWQRIFHDDPAPVRCLHLADFVAAAHHYWAPMLNIEGWATYTEELMRRAGFFADAEEELCVFVSQAVRWARVVVDASLHTGRMDTAQAERFLAEQTCISADFAAGEVQRYKRAPLQAITYALGWQRIEALAAASPHLPADFHAEFLAHGPVFPPDQTTP